MPKINVLPKSVAELIAAGEVVERPSSVVKELIENSIDAGAGNIAVEIKNGGVKYIRITDNGCGISRQDVRTAFISHATSKIKQACDLDAIFTLGFRGEALPSIAAVSRLSMLTKTADEETGTLFSLQGGEETELDDAGCPTGTTITVKDLFFNTPARMKFLKKDMTEGNYVSDVVSKAALSHPEIRFSLIKDGKQTLQTPGSGDLYSAIYAIFGKDVCEGLIKCGYEGDGIKINGYISKPLSNRPNRNMQHFYVNGRYVRLPVAAPALDEAYKNCIMIGKFPMCFLYIDINASKIDVNVHPAKTEIRFSEDSKIFEAIYYAAKSAITKGDSARPKIKLNSEKNIMAPFVPKAEQTAMSFSNSNNSVATMNFAEDIAHDLKADSKAKTTEATAYGTSFAQSSNAVNIDGNMPSKNIANVLKSEKQSSNMPQVIVNGGFTLNDTSSVFDAQNINTAGVNIEAGTGYSVPWQKKPNIDIKADYQDFDKQNNSEKTKNKELFEQKSTVADSNAVVSQNQEQPIKIIGEVFKTYILVECGTKLLIIDKHAAHERMIFNKLVSGEKAVYSQLMLSPVAVRLSGKEYTAVLENLNVFAKAGYRVEDFGDGTVIVRECPVELSKEDISQLITEIAGELMRGNLRPVPEKLDWLYHSTACRAAIKAGDNLKQQELELFVKALLADKNIRYCPHGRPVLYELSRHEIEKQFGRLG